MSEAGQITSKKKIAILGGGAGAMAAAFGLTSRPGWQEQYEVTVYQLGWRLGGKGASGRNAEKAQRIEEHGIHLWFGFYENAFAMMRQIYAELAERNLAPNSPFQSWRDAFIPQTAGGFMDPTHSGWQQLSASFPEMPGEPGEDTLFEGKGAPPTPWELVLRLLDSLIDRYERNMPAPGWAAHHETDLPGWVHDVTQALGLGLHHLEQSTLLHAARAFARKLSEDAAAHSRKERECLLHLLERFADRFFASLSEKVEQDLRLLAIAIDFGVTSLLGIVRDGVLENGFYCIDDRDLSEWLKGHGARYPKSAMVVSVYDAVFAYPAGSPDPSKRRLSAGAALYGNLLMTFTYRGSIAWRMCAGMGDAIFAPIYLVLKNRGVRFEFFHRVKDLKLSPDLTAVDQIQIDVQAATRNGRPYDPLVPVKGLPCWPSAPLYEQLEQGEAVLEGHYNLESAWTDWHDRLPAKTLRRGVDFDAVVLGISLGALRWICPDLLTASRKWQDMVDHVGTVQTQAMQLWLSRTATELGAMNRNGAAAVYTSYLEPFDTYADFSHLIGREDWPEQNHVRQIAYFCNALEEAAPVPAPFTDPEFPARELARVMQSGRRFLNECVHPIWPAGTSANAPEFDWNLLEDPSGADGERAFLAQYFRANIDPSERYVLSLPGTARYRLAPWDSGFNNLYLAGDWTLTGLDWGCVESAVMSGLISAQAICGYPQHIYGARPAPQSRSAG